MEKGGLQSQPQLIHTHARKRADTHTQDVFQNELYFVLSKALT